MLLRAAAERLAPVRGLRWVIGGACSGRSTVCRTIARWTGVPVYDMDEHVYGRYMSRYSAPRHPASTAWFKRGDGPVLVDGGITHRSVLASAEVLSRRVMEAFGLEP